MPKQLPCSMSLYRHAQHAALIQQAVSAVDAITRDASTAYPVGHPLRRALDQASHALGQVRSQGEACLYAEHPDAARASGFPHSDPAALERLWDRLDP